jgi:hypothetical protein
MHKILILPESNFVLELRREPFLNDVIWTLEVEVLEGLRILTQKVVGVDREKGYAEKATKVVNTWKFVVI